MHLFVQPLDLGSAVCPYVQLLGWGSVLVLAGLCPAVNTNILVGFYSYL